MSALAADTENQGGNAGRRRAAGRGVALDAGNSDFGGDSVAISGQTGTVSPLAGLDMDRIRDAIETIRAQAVCLAARAAAFSRVASGGGGFGGDALEVGALAEADGETSAASTPASRMGPSSG